MFKRNISQRIIGRHIAVRCLAGAILTCAVAVGVGVSTAASAQGVPASVHVGFLTLKEGAALGIHPSMSYEGSTPSPVVALGGVKPDSASGCNQAVCISVTGIGRIVEDWSTTAYFADGLESFAAYWENGVVIATSPPFYASPGTWYYDDWGHIGVFPNGAKLCNSWLGTPGFPCETVHS